MNRAGTYQVTGGDILVEDLECHVITDVFHIDLEGLVPERRLASSLKGSGLVLLLAGSEDAVGVHLGEELGVTSELRLDHVNAQASGSGHIYKFNLSL